MWEHIGCMIFVEYFDQEYIELHLAVVQVDNQLEFGAGSAGKRMGYLRQEQYSISYLTALVSVVVVD